MTDNEGLEKELSIVKRKYNNEANTNTNLSKNIASIYYKPNTENFVSTKTTTTNPHLQEEIIKNTNKIISKLNLNTSKTKTKKSVNNSQEKDSELEKETEEVSKKILSIKNANLLKLRPSSACYNTSADKDKDGAVNYNTIEENSSNYKRLDNESSSKENFNKIKKSFNSKVGKVNEFSIKIPLIQNPVKKVNHSFGELNENLNSNSSNMTHSKKENIIMQNIIKNTQNPKNTKSQILSTPTPPHNLNLNINSNMEFSNSNSDFSSNKNRFFNIQIQSQSQSKKERNGNFLQENSTSSLKEEKEGGGGVTKSIHNSSHLNHLKNKILSKVQNEISSSKLLKSQKSNEKRGLNTIHTIESNYIERKEEKEEERELLKKVNKTRNKTPTTFTNEYKTTWGVMMEGNKAAEEGEGVEGSTGIKSKCNAIIGLNSMESSNREENNEKKPSLNINLKNFYTKNKESRNSNASKAVNSTSEMKFSSYNNINKYFHRATNNLLNSKTNLHLNLNRSKEKIEVQKQMKTNSSNDPTNPEINKMIKYSNFASNQTQPQTESKDYIITDINDENATKMNLVIDNRGLKEGFKNSKITGNVGNSSSNNKYISNLSHFELKPTKNSSSSNMNNYTNSNNKEYPRCTTEVKIEKDDENSSNHKQNQINYNLLNHPHPQQNLNEKFTFKPSYLANTNANTNSNTSSNSNFHLFSHAPSTSTNNNNPLNKLTSKLISSTNSKLKEKEKEKSKEKVFKSKLSINPETMNNNINYSIEVKRIDSNNSSSSNCINYLENCGSTKKSSLNSKHAHVSIESIVNKIKTKKLNSEDVERNKLKREKSIPINKTEEGGVVNSEFSSGSRNGKKEKLVGNTYSNNNYSNLSNLNSNSIGFTGFTGSTGVNNNHQINMSKISAPLIKNKLKSQVNNTTSNK